MHSPNITTHAQTPTCQLVAMDNITANDTSFGPQLQGKFDFTLLFQQIILSILPSSLFVVASSAYVSRLLRKPICVRSGALLWSKLVRVKMLAHRSSCLSSLQICDISAQPL